MISLPTLTQLHWKCLIHWSHCIQEAHGQEIQQDVGWPLIGRRSGGRRQEICQDVSLPLIGPVWKYSSLMFSPFKTSPRHDLWPFPGNPGVDLARVHLPGQYFIKAYFKFTQGCGIPKINTYRPCLTYNNPRCPLKPPTQVKEDHSLKKGTSGILLSLPLLFPPLLPRAGIMDTYQCAQLLTQVLGTQSGVVMLAQQVIY